MPRPPRPDERAAQLLEEVKTIIDKLEDLGSDEEAQKIWQQFGRDIHAWNIRADDLLGEAPF